MRALIKVMKALSDPNRVKIMKVLHQKQMCVCEIQACLGLSQPTVSKHLRVLEDAGLVDFHKDGVWVNYHIANGQANPYVADMIEHLKYWVSDDPDVAAIVEMLPEINREDIVKK